MRYYATMQNDIIVSKGINYTDVVAENEITLTEEQYDTIPIPCKIDGDTFVPCDFPEVESVDLPPVTFAQISTGSYVGNMDSRKGITLNFDFVPRLIFITGESAKGSKSYATLINPLSVGHSRDINCDSQGYASLDNHTFMIEWNEKSVRFYTPGSYSNAMNYNWTYNYIAIG